MPPRLAAPAQEAAFELAQEHVLTLPMYPELTPDQIEEVVGEIGRFVNR